MFTTLAQRYLPALDDTMRRVVDRVTEPEDFAVMVRYPLGWVDTSGAPYSHSTGKRIRPILLLLSAEAAGGEWQQALPAAAAVELLHNFSLIHDDIQDRSPTRHGRPTVWVVWGEANAINAGDAIFTLAYCALESLSGSGLRDSTLLEAWRIFNATTLELTRGQHLDMRFEKQVSVTTDEYLSMISGKSAALVAGSAQIGALLGSQNFEVAAHIAEFGLNLGTAFQIRDDILGIWGDPKVTGKSAATDILSRKKSLPVLHALSRSAELAEIYQRERFGEADVPDAIRALDAAGALDYAQEREAHYYQQALAALQRADLRGRAAEGLLELTEWLFRRDR